MHDDLFQRYLHDADPRTREKLIQAYRPLVFSVCRRFRRDPQDVEDAAQDTFLKFVQGAAAITGSASAWLASAAHTSSIDLIRRTMSEKRRRGGLAAIGSALTQRSLLHEAIGHRLA